MASSRRSASSPIAIRPDDLAHLLRQTLADDFELPATTDAPPLIVAFSGGIDSTVLLHALAHCWPVARLTAVHVHHHLQAIADQWPAACRRFADTLGVAFVVLDAEGAPAPGDSIEQWARDTRYRLLSDQATKMGACAVLTAHHADDQVETLLMRQERGTGVRGLAGILPRRHVRGVAMIRPLLGIRRATLHAYATVHRLAWVEDPSNAHLGHARNRIRHEVMPGIDADEHRRLLALADASRTRTRAIDRQAADDLTAAAVSDPMDLQRDGLSVLDRRPLRALPAERTAWALRHWLQASGAPPPSRAQTDELMRQLIISGASDAQLKIGDLAVLRHRERLYRVPGAIALRTRSAAARGLAPTRVLLASPGGPIDLPAGLGQLQLRAAPGAAAPPDSIVGALWVLGGQHSGLRLRRQASPFSRTLKNLYQEAAIPPWLRGLYPVLLVDGQVLYSAAFGHDADRQGRLGGAWFDWQPTAPGALVALLRWHVRLPTDRAAVG